MLNPRSGSLSSFSTSVGPPRKTKNSPLIILDYFDELLLTTKVKIFCANLPFSKRNTPEL